MNEFKKFLQFTKVEEVNDGNVIVWGIATEQTPDLDNERCIYASAVPVYREWSDAAAKRTSGAGQEISLGPIRLQHSIDIGGKATKLQFLDEEKQIWLGSEPLNEEIRNDLKKGFYTGYSQGGTYAWRKCSQCESPMPIRQGDNFCTKCQADVVVDYALKHLTEVSYVDSPCSGVGFDYVKNDGSRRLVKFQRRNQEMDPNNPVLTAEQADKILAAIEKAKAKTKRVAGVDLPSRCFAYVGDPEKTETWKLPIEFPGDEEKTKRHIRNALARFNQTQGIPAEEKPKVKAKIVAAAKKHGIDVGEEEQKAAAFHEKTVTMFKQRIDARGDVKKNLYDVGACAELLMRLAYLYENAFYERDMEGDESAVPEELEDILANLIDTFVAMAQEESSELAARVTGKSTKGEKPMTPEEQETLNKAAKKSLASHFAKHAMHHEKMQAEEEKKAASHQGMCDVHKAHAEKCKAAKADVGADNPHAGVAAVLENQQEFHKAAASHHAEMAKCCAKCAKAHGAMAEHLHKMSEEHDGEEHEKTVKAIKAEAPGPDPVVKKAETPSMEDDVAAEAAKMRETPEYKKSISDIAAAKVQAEVEELRKKTLAPDGVRLTGNITKAGEGLHVVARDDEQKIDLYKPASGGNFAGL